MPQFNWALARQDGFSDAEIADHLGKTYGFNAALARADGASDADIITYLNKRAGLQDQMAQLKEEGRAAQTRLETLEAYESDKDVPLLMRSELGRQTAGGLARMAGGVVGLGAALTPGEVSRSLLETSRELSGMADIPMTAPRTFSEARETGDVSGYVGALLAQQIPQMLATGATAGGLGLGGLSARATGYLGPLISTAPQEAGALYSDIVEATGETGLRQRAAAVGGGLLSGALESFGAVPAGIARRIAGRTVDEAAQEAAQRTLKGFAKDIAKGTLSEAGTEAGQEAVSMLSVGAGGGELPTAQEALSRIQEAAIAGAATGGLIGGIQSGVAGYADARREARLEQELQDYFGRLGARSVDRGNAPVAAIYGAPFQETVDTSGTQVSPEGGIGQTYKGVGVPFRTARPNNAAARRAAIEAGMYQEAPVPEAEAAVDVLKGPFFDEERGYYDREEQNQLGQARTARTTSESKSAAENIIRNELRDGDVIETADGLTLTVERTRGKKSGIERIVFVNQGGFPVGGTSADLAGNDGMRVEGPMEVDPVQRSIVERSKISRKPTAPVPAAEVAAESKIGQYPPEGFGTGVIPSQQEVERRAAVRRLVAERNRAEAEARRAEAAGRIVANPQEEARIMAQLQEEEAAARAQMAEEEARIMAQLQAEQASVPLGRLEAAQASRYGAATRPIAPEPRPTLGMSPEVAQRLRDLRAQEQRQLQQINEATVQVPEARQPAVQEGGQGAQGTGRVDRQAEVRQGQVPADVTGRAEVVAATESLPLDRLRRPNGAIGTQGVSPEGVKSILVGVSGIQIPDGASMRQMVDMLRNSPEGQRRLRAFTEQYPIAITELPDGTVQLKDGHHRAFLLDQLGDSTVPVTRKESTAPNVRNETLSDELPPPPASIQSSAAPAPTPAAQTGLVYADETPVASGDSIKLSNKAFGPETSAKLGKSIINGVVGQNPDGSVTVRVTDAGVTTRRTKAARATPTLVQKAGVSLGDMLTFRPLAEGGYSVDRVSANGTTFPQVRIKSAAGLFTKRAAEAKREPTKTEQKEADRSKALGLIAEVISSEKYSQFERLLDRSIFGEETAEEKAERNEFIASLSDSDKIIYKAAYFWKKGPQQIALRFMEAAPGVAADPAAYQDRWDNEIAKFLIRGLKDKEWAAKWSPRLAQRSIVVDAVREAKRSPVSLAEETQSQAETTTTGQQARKEEIPPSEAMVSASAADIRRFNLKLISDLAEFIAGLEQRNRGVLLNTEQLRAAFDRIVSSFDRASFSKAFSGSSTDVIRTQLDQAFQKVVDLYNEGGAARLVEEADAYDRNEEDVVELLSRNVGPATGLTVAAVEDRLLSRFGIQAGGLVRVVNDPNANFDGRIFISKADGRIVGIEINSAKVSSAADIDRVLLHELSEAANANGELATEISQVTPDEAAEIAAEVARLEYDPAAVSREEDARKVELLAKAWSGRNWFQRITGRVLAWANSKGVRLTRLAAEYIAAKAVAKVHARVSRPSTTSTVNGNEVVETLYSKTPFKTRAQVESETRRPGLEQSQVTTIEQSASVQRGILPAGLGAQLAGLSQDAERGMRWLKSLNEISTTSIPLSSINPNDPNKGIFSYAVWNQNKNILDILAKKNAKLEALREQMTSPRLISMLAEAMAAKSAAQVAETAQRALLRDYSKYIRNELRTFAGVDAALERAKVNATNAALYVKKQNADISKAIDIISDAVPDSVIAASKAAGNNDAIIKYVVDNNVLSGKVLPETITNLLTPPASGKQSVLESYRGLASSLKAIKEYKANIDLAAADRKAFEDYFALASTSPAAKSKKVSIEDFAKRYYRERSTKEAELERLKALNLEIERIDNEFAATLEQIALLESVVASPEFKDSYATATKNLGYSNPEILGTTDPRGRGERWVVDGQEYFFNPQLDVTLDTQAGIDFYKLVAAVEARLQQLRSNPADADPVELESLTGLSERLRIYGPQTASPALTSGFLNPFSLGRRIPGIKALVNRMTLARLIPGPMGKRLSLLNSIQDSLEKKLSAVKANKFFGTQALKVAQYRAIQSHPGMDPMVWREEVANELLNSRQNDRDPMIKVGEATPFGHIVTKEDLAAIELMARFSDQVYAVTSGDSAGGVVKYFPTLIMEGNRFRRAFAAGAATTPRRLLRENYAGSPIFYVQKIIDAINNNKDENAQLKAIEAIFDDPTAFIKILRRYVAETNSDFQNTSDYAKIYEQLAIRWRKDPASAPTTTDELVSQIADMSPAALPIADLEAEIKRSLLEEIRKIAIAVDSEKLVSQQEARNYIDQSSNGAISGGSDTSPTAIVSVVDGLNQFTKPRGKMVAPGVFYSYTLSTDAEMNGLLVAAQIPSLIQIARQMMDVESALKQYIINIGERMKNDPESLKKDIKSGKIYIDRSQAETLLSLTQTLRDTFTQRVQGINVYDDSGLLGQVGLAQKILLLTTPMVPITNYLFGVAGGDVVARAMTRGKGISSAPSALLSAGTKPILRLIERAVVNNKTLSDVIRRNRRAFGAFAERFIRVSDEYARVAQMAKMGGWSPEAASPLESAKLISEMGTYGNVVRQPGEVDSRATRLIDRMFSNRAVASLREFMMSMQPKADELANDEISRSLLKHLAVMFMAGERMMQIRSKSANPGWDNWANPDNVISSKEAFENAGWTPEQLIILKDILVPAGSLEFLLTDYHKRVEAARKAGTDIYSVPLIADQNAESDVLMRALAASNLPVDSARADVIKTRGAFGRAIRFLIGFPGWMSNWLGTLEGLSSVSTDRKNKYMSAAIQLASFAVLILLLMLAGIPANEAKSLAYGVITGRPYSQTTIRDIIADPSVKNLAKLGGVSIAGMVPYWGEIAAGFVGAQKNRADLTDLTKLSPQLGAISTLAGALKYANSTGDYTGAVLSAVRGTLPVLNPVMNRIPSVGSRDAVADAVRVASRNAGSLELKTRGGGGGGMEPTEFSSLIRRAVAANAAGDTAGAQQLLNRAAEVKAATGVSDPWSAVKSSLKSQFPEQKAFGRMLSADEKIGLRSRMSPEQRAVFDRGDAAIQKLVDGIKPKSERSGGMPSAMRRIRALTRGPKALRMIKTKIKQLRPKKLKLTRAGRSGSALPSLRSPQMAALGRASLAQRRRVGSMSPLGRGYALGMPAASIGI